VREALPDGDVAIDHIAAGPLERTSQDLVAWVVFLVRPEEHHPGSRGRRGHARPRPLRSEAIARLCASIKAAMPSWSLTGTRADSLPGGFADSRAVGANIQL
jgi:hypothetical protein